MTDKTPEQRLHDAALSFAHVASMELDALNNAVIALPLGVARTDGLASLKAIRVAEKKWQQAGQAFLESLSGTPPKTHVTSEQAKSLPNR